jgi:hypothetical protein
LQEKNNRNISKGSISMPVISSASIELKPKRDSINGSVSLPVKHNWDGSSSSASISVKSKQENGNGLASMQVKSKRPKQPHITARKLIERYIFEEQLEQGPKPFTPWKRRQRGKNSKQGKKKTSSSIPIVQHVMHKLNKGPPTDKITYVVDELGETTRLNYYLSLLILK